VLIFWNCEDSGRERKMMKRDEGEEDKAENEGMGGVRRVPAFI